MVLPVHVQVWVQIPWARRRRPTPVIPADVAALMRMQPAELSLVSGIAAQELAPQQAPAHPAWSAAVLWTGCEGWRLNGSCEDCIAFCVPLRVCSVGSNSCSVDYFRAGSCCVQTVCQLEL